VLHRAASPEAQERFEKHVLPLPAHRHLFPKSFVDVSARRWLARASLSQADRAHAQLIRKTLEHVLPYARTHARTRA
jgi:hypothetical protein